MAESKVIRVVGQSSTVLFDPADPFNPQNRRIGIVVLNRKTEEAILRDGKLPEVDAAPADAAARPAS
jgi:chemotaxis protein MotB